jgi:hypothetical protein
LHDEEAFYRKSVLSYWRTRDYYRESGQLNPVDVREKLPSSSSPARNPYDRLIQWFGAGQRKRKIGSVHGYDYMSGGADLIELFLDRPNAQVTQIVWWS